MRCREMGDYRDPVVTLEGQIFDVKSLPNKRLHFLCLASSALIWAFGGHAVGHGPFILLYVPYDCLKIVYGVLTLLFFLRIIFFKIMYTGTCLGL